MSWTTGAKRETRIIKANTITKLPSPDKVAVGRRSNGVVCLVQGPSGVYDLCGARALVTRRAWLSCRDVFLDIAIPTFQFETDHGSRD